MAISCPYCRHSMTVKDAKPGKYKPKCAKCGKRFALTVPADGSAPVPAVLAEELKLPEETLVSPVSARSTLSHGAGAEGGTTVSEATIAVSPPLSPPAAVLPQPAAPTGGAPAEDKGVLTHPGVTDRTLPPDADATGDWSVSAPPAADVTTPGRAIELTDGTGSNQPTRGDFDATPRSPGAMPSQIGGYKIVRELGRGAMGAVYLAKQISLDREVALKTIQAQWADNPTFVARFTREAYAAAQLTHHNVVQIHDLGVDGDTNYFSMELVRGESLDHVIKQAGKLDAELAVGYVLQAARGLEFAHNHGMVHRDIKPANLMLSEHGVVKVADLGLVKTPQLLEEDALTDAPAASAVPKPLKTGGSSLAAATADVTLVNRAMGTPAYMAPEQAENAAGVDHRADIYSLGCTLYVLLTGRPPFEGASALEVMSKHKTEPVVRPEAIVKRLSPALSEITLKMVAKRPEDRYQNLGEVIKALEGFLGIQSAGTFSPREEDALALESSLAKFNRAGLAGLRGPIVLGAAALWAVLILAGLALSWGFAVGVLALGVAATAAYFVLSGLKERTHLFGKFRELLATTRWSDWLTWLVGGLLLAVVLWLVGWLWWTVGMAMFGVVLGLAYHFVVDGRTAAERREPLEKMEQLLKGLRLKGVSEASLQQFVAKYSGQHWEEFFEALFGYEAKLAARQQWGRGDQGRDRPKFRGWRDVLVRWIDGRVQAHREARDRRHLQQIEEKNLRAQGVDIVAARKQSQHMADALLDEAADARAAAAVVATPTAGQTVIDPKLEAAKKRQRVKTMLSDARKGAYQAKRRRLVGVALSPLSFALGGKMRFLLGCLLIAGCLLWARQNHLLTHEGVEQVKSAVATSVDQRNASGLAASAVVAADQKLQPLAWPVIGPYLSSFNAGIAGLVLVFLGLFRGWKMSLFALPAAAIMVLGAGFGIPPLFTLESAHLGSLAIGLVIATGGFFFGRTYAD